MLHKASNLIGSEEANTNCIEGCVSKPQCNKLCLEIIVSIDNKITQRFCTNNSDIHLILKHLYLPWAKALSKYNDLSIR